MWRKLFGKKEKDRKTEKEDKIDSLKNIQSVIEFLKEIRSDKSLLLPELEKLEELEKEMAVAKEGLRQINLNSQAKILDKILERYQFFQNDADINGIRVKQIASHFLKRAEEAGMKDLAEEKKKDMKWNFDW